MKRFAILALFASAGILFAAEPVIWNAKNNFDGWNNFSFAKGSVADGCLRFSEIKFDCRVVNSKISIDPSLYDAFVVKYRAKGINATGGEFFFAHGNEPDSEKQKWATPQMIADGEWHTMTITGKDLSGWLNGGKITRLRFDPTNGAGGTIDIAEMKLVKLEKPAPVWNKENDFADWKGHYNCKISRTDGVLTLTDIKADCHIANYRTGIDPKLFNTISFTYRAKGTGPASGEIFFRHGSGGFTQKCCIGLPDLVADGEWHTITVSPTKMAPWLEGGNITGLRLDPTNSPGGKIEIKEIRLLKRDLSNQTGKLDAPLWPQVKSELWVRKTASVGPYFAGKMIRCPEDLPQGEKSSTVFF